MVVPDAAGSTTVAANNHRLTTTITGARVHLIGDWGDGGKGAAAAPAVAAASADAVTVGAAISSVHFAPTFMILPVGYLMLSAAVVHFQTTSTGL